MTMVVSEADFEVGKITPIVELQDAINRTVANMAAFAQAMGYPFPANRCEFSDLYERECSHCTGDDAWWEPAPKPVIYD